MGVAAVWALALQGTLEGSLEPSVPSHVMSLHLCPAERGTISSIELDGSRFRVVREGLHGLSLFAIGEGFLLWSTTSANGESICCALPSSSYCTRTRGLCQPLWGAGCPSWDPASHPEHPCGRR